MMLYELIAALEAAEPGEVLNGFHHPHSYRGYYDQLAFEPKDNVTVADMLRDAKLALGSTYRGWKGGEFTMDKWTECWLAEIGGCGEQIGPRLLAYMLAERSKP